MKKLLIPLILSLLAAACGEKPHRPERAAAKPPVPVDTVAVASAEWPLRYEAVGTVRAKTVAIISSKVMGYVNSVNVRVGDRVRQGQLLVELDARDLDAGYRSAVAGLNEANSAVPEVENAMAAAQANLELAEVTFRRMKDLFDKKSVSNQEYDEASARLKAAQANHQISLSRREQLRSKIGQAREGVKSAEVMKSYARIEAPFAGGVTEKHADTGSLATPGAPLVVLEREGVYRLEASVEESRIAQVREGQPASVVLDALGTTVTSRVSEIVPSVDPASRAYIVKIDLPGAAQIRSGMFGRAIFTLGATKAMTVPAGAVIERGQLRQVLVVEEGIARARLVTVGAARDGQQEVLSGLNPGERVVFPLPPGVGDGDKVEARP